MSTTSAVGCCGDDTVEPEFETTVDPKLGGADNALYSGVAVFGRIYATIGAIIGALIALILIIVGISRFRDPRTQEVSAAIIDNPRCNLETDTKLYSCAVTVQYSVEGQRYTAHIVFSSLKVPQKGDIVSLQYVPGDPQNVTYEMSPRLAGWLLIGGGLLLGGITAGIAALTFKYKPFAAGYGAISGVGMLARVI